MLYCRGGMVVIDSGQKQIFEKKKNLKKIAAAHGRSGVQETRPAAAVLGSRGLIHN